MLDAQMFFAFFSAHPGAWIAAWAVLGALLGSFFNAMAWRWPQIIDRQWLEEVGEAFEAQGWAMPAQALAELAKPKMGFSFPRSQCPHCASPIPIWRNIPIVSWLLLRGRCADCHAPISPRYLVVEALCALLGGALAWHLAPSPEAVCWIGFCMALALCAAVDAQSFYLPDPLTYGILWGGLLARALGWLPNGLAVGVYGAVLGFLFLRAVGWIGRRLFGREALGLGDSKLLAAELAWLGPMGLLPLLLSASVLGLIGAFVSWAWARAHGRAGRERREIPFGPYLAAAGLLCLLFQGAFWAYLGR
jgi:leader peptidase (prepilin peptidase) / N-methyltransferase